MALKASEATHCARDQGKFWEMHDRLFANQRQLTPWKTHAEALGLDVNAFEACLSSDKYAKKVRRDMAAARKSGFSGTPSFILARTDPDDPSKVKGISSLRGAQPFRAFKAQIDKALKAEAKAK